MFAGRIPTEAEYTKVEGGTEDDLRRAIRGLMQGPGFHEFLIRGSNDRLLTDRDFEIVGVDGEGFVNYPRATYRLREMEGIDEQALNDRRLARPYYRYVERAQYGLRRAPLELIAYLAETDGDYREVLTAPYIMANPWSAEVYGANPGFGNPLDPHTFKPSAITSYYRPCDGRAIEERQFGYYVESEGACPTDFPHAGILNTKVFLQRYPTTPTNRNRARSRWTYYHFLGFDIERSESRTMDPDVLEDMNNPTLHNPACTACHVRLDPVAGAFQNYGDRGLYRDQDGGLDSLDRFYKYEPSGRIDIQVGERSREGGITELGTVRLLADQDSEIGLKNLRTFEGDTKLHLGLGEVLIRDLNGDIVHRYETRHLVAEEDCGGPIEGGYRLWDCEELLVLPLEASDDGDYTVQIEAWVTDQGEKAATLQVWMPGPFYRIGDTWYRDMRAPGFADAADPSVSKEHAHRSLQWLAQRIVEDDRFADASAKFWWPAIMGTEVAEQPQEENDATYKIQALAANVQGEELRRLAQGFRRGFGWSDKGPYNLKDLLSEIAASKWFRADSLFNDDGIRMLALRDVGARRLLTPEELTRKTDALTGFLWGRELGYDEPPGREEQDNLRGAYRLMYGGIDSDGITERARDLTAIMANVAKSHAVESSCPIVFRELYLLPDGKRPLFSGIDERISPIFEASRTFSIAARSWSERETWSVRSHLVQGGNSVTVRSTNYFQDENTGKERHARLDRVVVRDAAETAVEVVELEDLNLSDQVCGERDYNEDTEIHDHILLWGECSLTIPIKAPVAGHYDIEMVGWADQVGDELAEIETVVQSDTTNSVGSSTIRRKIAEIYERLHGPDVDSGSTEVEAAYHLFVDVWKRKRELAKSGSSSFFEPLYCDLWQDHDYYDGILEGTIVERENDGERYYNWDYEKVRAFRDEVDPQDHHGVARSWVVVLAFVLMDYRYLYL